MKKRNNKHIKRVRKLIVMCLLCAIILTVSTYAWFIGMKTVNVSSFDVSIASIDSLSLSLDGKTWSDTVDINKGNYATVNTSNNTNSWGGSGLVPASSIGVIEATSSTLKMYEKGSLTTTAGGYRLMASAIPNATVASGAVAGTEADGYVAFDLFVKNLSGRAYYKEYDPKNEEAIYLTTDSTVKVAEGGVKNTGIENSVRVAFAQIGRVIATTTDQATVTGLKCGSATATSDTDPTSICRVATIWEPNDKSHVANAVNWYNTSCRARTGATTNADASYSGNCKSFGDGTYVQTYAVAGPITDSTSVDVYDGADYNGYTDSIATGDLTAETAGKLNAFNYFTDSEKVEAGNDRPTFFTLTPNSITKVRIYIYIEGQDIDNYDFASLGKKISVAFGLTKERYYDTDVNYDSTNTATLPDDVVKASHPSVTRGE